MDEVEDVGEVPQHRLTSKNSGISEFHVIVFVVYTVIVDLQLFSIFSLVSKSLYGLDFSV